ncbi:hypothetical protein Tco_0303791 [Tanacetum coccineum]
MTTLKFADTHNLVVFLSKPAKSEGFEQIVKTVNGEVQLQALVDGKKIIITESTVRRDLQLEDAEGVDCLPNSTIFEQLTLMGYEKISQKLTFYKAFFSPQWKFLIHTILQCLSSKTTAWNEFSSTMASAIICLATNQKFNFSKYIFESMVKNLDNAGNFLMYPRFIQVFLDKQLEGMPTHNRIYIAPSHTKKIFRNMRRVGKGFSGRETPLFQTMVVQDQAEMGEDNVADEAVNKKMDDSLERAATTATSLDAEQDKGNINKTQSKETPNEAGSQGTTLGGGPKCQETMGILLLKLDTTKTTQANEIASLKWRVIKLEMRNKSITHGLKKMYRVCLTARVESSRDEDLDDVDMFDVNDLYGDEVIVDNVDFVKTIKETTTTATITDVEVTLAQALAESKSAKPKAVKVMIQELEQGITTTIPTTIISVPKPPQDKGKGIMIEEPVVEQVKPMKRLEQMRLDEELSFKLQAEEEEERLAREKAHQTKEAIIAWDDNHAKIEADYYKEENILQLREHKRRGTDHQQELNKGVSYEFEQENAKKQKVDKDKETAELQRLKEVVPDEEEVAIDVVPLATKPPTIVDVKIHKEGKKSYYQIIRADGKSQMYRVFSQMLKSFSREDLEDLYMLGDLKIMFEPHVEDQVWRNKDNYSVLDWKLYDSCGVHSLRKQNVYIHMLVEKRYPLTPAIITDMLNKKLQADHFSEMAYQLLKLLTKQLKN